MLELIRISPRFGIMLGAMLLSIAFTVLDILSVTDVLKKDLPAGIDPFWELAFVFKLLTDTVILDDFKTALDRLHTFKLSALSRLNADSDEGFPGRPSDASVIALERVPVSSSKGKFSFSGFRGSSGSQRESKAQSSHVEAPREMNNSSSVPLS